MSRPNIQSISILCFLGLFAVLYFGCDTKNKDQKAVEKSRANNIELISVDRLIREARPQMSTNGRSDLILLEGKLQKSPTDSTKLDVYKSLASLWYSERQPIISGSYAEKIALLENTEQAWSIAGTTYGIAAQRVTDDIEKKHAIIKSRNAFENVLSINSQNIDSKINLALSYVDLPEEDNPMKGIMMLLDLNKQYPDNIPVLLQLGRLGLGTNQLDKSVKRLSKVVSLDPNNKEAHCLLAEVYRKKGDSVKAQEEQNKCDLK